MGVGGVVVERADVVPTRILGRVEVAGAGVLREIARGVALATQTGSSGHVEVLAPASGGRLKADDDVGDVPGLRRSVPGGIAMERHAARAETFFGRRRLGSAGSAFGCQCRAVDAHLLLRAVEVGGPDGAVLCRELCDARRRDGLSGCAGTDDCRMDWGEREKATEKKRDVRSHLERIPVGLDGGWLGLDAEGSVSSWTVCRSACRQRPWPLRASWRGLRAGRLRRLRALP